MPLRLKHDLRQALSIATDDGRWIESIERNIAQIQTSFLLLTDEQQLAYELHGVYCRRDHHQHACTFENEAWYDEPSQRLVKTRYLNFAQTLLRNHRGDLNSILVDLEVTLEYLSRSL